MSERIWYSSSGDLGDIIFQVCAMKAHSERHYAGKSFDVYLFDFPGRTAHGMTKEKAASIGTLLKTQPYISDVIFTGEHKDSNVNGFRYHSQVTLVEKCLATLGVATDYCHKPWIHLQEKVECDVLIARSVRYRGACPYRRILQKYKNRCSFIGIYDEWKNFCQEFDTNIPWQFTPNLLEVAKLINGCKLFIGNQSCPMAIALAMAAPLIQEVCHRCPNCILPRENAMYSWNDNLQLPEV